MDGLRLVPLGITTLDSTALASSVALTLPSFPTGVGHADIVVLSVSGANSSVNWRDDGVAPTSSVGINLATGAVPFEYSGTVTALRFITSTGTPTLTAAFYKIAG